MAKIGYFFTSSTHCLKISWNSWNISTYFARIDLISFNVMVGSNLGRVPFLYFSTMVNCSSLSFNFWWHPEQILVLSCTQPGQLLHFKDATLASEFGSLHLAHLQSKKYFSFNSFCLSWVFPHGSKYSDIPLKMCHYFFWEKKMDSSYFRSGNFTKKNWANNNEKLH